MAWAKKKAGGGAKPPVKNGKKRADPAQDGKKGAGSAGKRPVAKLARHRPLGARLRRLALGLALGALLGPLVLVVPVRFVDPPTTMMMLARTLDRWRKDARPYYPRRRVVPLAQIAPVLRHAVLAAEDQAFYLHHGFDAKQIEDALTARREGRKLRGASTLSQQTVKNLYLWSGRSLVRKGLEAYLTVYLELLLPKDRILELYLNLVETGDGFFGVEEAAQRHWKKPASALSPEEAARLAAILPSPRRWSPLGEQASARAARIREKLSVPIPRPR